MKISKQEEKELREVWCDSAIVISPFYYTICLSEKQFKQQMQIAGVPKTDYPESYQGSKTSNATCWTFTPSAKDKYKEFIIVTVDNWQDKTPEQVVALIVHEATHIKQKIVNRLGGIDVGAEFEAYTMQNIVQNLLYAFNTQRERLERKKKK